MLLNHRKHGARDVLALGREGASVDPCSSFVAFDGWTSRFTPLVVALAARENAALRPVPPPRSWLLREGWRKHGLVDPSEVPGARGRGRPAP